MKVTVVVPVHNTAEHLERCIAALRAQDYPREQFEILMVDNNSTDGSAGILGRADGVRGLSEPKQGSYAARNRALREARGDVLALTDSDCAPVAGWLRAIERAFEAPRVKVVLGCRRPGRDRLLRERGWRATIAGSLARFAHHCGAGLWAIVRHRGKVGLALAGVPGALGICWLYYGLYFAGEAATLLGVGAIRRVQV